MIRDNIADQLILSTSKIICYNNSGSASSGTCFLMLHTNASNEIFYAFATNKHVVDGFSSAKLVIGRRDQKSNNALSFPPINLLIDDLQKYCIPHPDHAVDICLMPMNAFMNSPEQLLHANFCAIDTRMAYKAESLGDICTSIEDIIMIGYPNGLMDEAHCRPVVRAGITATDLRLDYNDTPDFMIDAACFPGCSGSPVFLRKLGLQKEQIPNGVNIGIVPSYTFIGVLHSGPQLTIDGQFINKDIPTAVMPVPEVKTMMHLGHVTKAHKVVEMFSMPDVIKKLR